jgi:hypothetical protein
VFAGKGVGAWAGGAAGRRAWGPWKRRMVSRRRSRCSSSGALSRREDARQNHAATSVSRPARPGANHAPRALGVADARSGAAQRSSLRGRPRAPDQRLTVDTLTVPGARTGTGAPANALPPAVEGGPDSPPPDGERAGGAAARGRALTRAMSARTSAAESLRPKRSRRPRGRSGNCERMPPRTSTCSSAVRSARTARATDSASLRAPAAPVGVAPPRRRSTPPARREGAGRTAGLGRGRGERVQ